MTPSSHHPTAKELRSFGLLMGGVFLLVGVWPLIFHGEGLRLWASLIAGAFGAAGLLVPKVLEPLHRLWMKFGEKIGWFNSRVILGLMFFGVFTPMAWVMGLLGKRPLQLGYDSKADSYRVLKKARAADHVLKPF